MTQALHTQDAVHYHMGQFPPEALDYVQPMPGMLDATAALARYDQMLRGLPNSELFLAPLRGLGSGGVVADGRHDQHTG